MALVSPKGPYRLVTVNNAPERAKRLIGRVVNDLKDQYIIEYVANCISQSRFYRVSSASQETNESCR